MNVTAQCGLFHGLFQRVMNPGSDHTISCTTAPPGAGGSQATVAAWWSRGSNPTFWSVTQSFNPLSSPCAKLLSLRKSFFWISMTAASIKTKNMRKVCSKTIRQDRKWVREGHLKTSHTALALNLDSHTGAKTQHIQTPWASLRTITLTAAGRRRRAAPTAEDQTQRNQRIKSPRHGYRLNANANAKAIHSIRDKKQNTTEEQKIKQRNKNQKHGV